MAKSSGPNMIEQHVEKVVLGLAVLAVLFSLIHFVASSPRRIEIQGQTLAPDQVDNAVVEDGKKLEEAIVQAKPPSAEAAKKSPNAPAPTPDDGRGDAQFVPERVARARKGRGPGRARGANRLRRRRGRQPVFRSFSG